MIGVWNYKDYKITVTVNGNFAFRHKGLIYSAQTLDNAKLMIDALNTNITVNKYAIVEELEKVETEFVYIMHIIGRTCGFKNLLNPEVANFRHYIQNLVKKYEEIGE